MIGVIGFKLNIVFNICGTLAFSTISTPYITGVMYCNAITTIPRMYCKSLRYTVSAETISPIPRHNIYSTIITTGRYNNATGLIPLPEKISTINTTTNVRIMLMNALVTVDIGITSLGKYIFLTMLDSRIIHVEPS